MVIDVSLSAVNLRSVHGHAFIFLTYPENAFSHNTRLLNITIIYSVN